MPHLIARVLLAFLVLPLSILLFAFLSILVIGVVRQGRPPGPLATVGVWTCVTAFVMTYWICVWRGVVRWTSRRVQLTCVATAITIGIGCMACAIVARFAREIYVGGAFGGALTQALWIASSVLIWLETKEERADRLRAAGAATVACPACGYNLTGLRDTRCPECGASFPLEDLIAAQRDRMEVIAK